MSFSVTFLKILQEAELLHSTSRLFFSIITPGKKIFLKKFVFALEKKGFDLFKYFYSIRGTIF